MGRICKNNIDKENLNGLYNELVNTVIDDIDKVNYV